MNIGRPRKIIEVERTPRKAPIERTVPPRREAPTEQPVKREPVEVPA